MTTLWFRRATLGVCVVAAMVVYFWPSMTPAEPPRAAPPRQPTSSPPATPVAVTRPAASTSTATRQATAAISDPDRRPPAPVSNLTLAGNTLTTFTVAWTEAAGATRYEVLVNGLSVVTVRGTDATLEWPGDVEESLIQVAALDDSGNRSEWRAIVIIAPTVIVTTVEPSPTGSPSSSAPTTPPPGGETTPTLSVTPSGTATPVLPSTTPLVTPSVSVGPRPPTFTTTPWPPGPPPPTLTVTPVAPRTTPGG